MSYKKGKRSEDQVHLDSVIENLQTGTLTDRLQNLKDLKAIFEKSNKADNLCKLTDKSYHRVYEVAFKIALEEKANVINGKKTTLARAQNRLEVCADAIRLAIKAGASKLKHKTIEAVVDHITQTLPQANGEYYPELSRPYLKALSFVFEHRANAERLQNSLWTSVVEFCLNGIDHYMESNADASLGLTRSFSGLRTGHISGSSPMSSLGNGISQTKNGPMSRQNVEDLLSVLLPLISVTNAPILDNAERITNIVLRLLKSHISAVNAVHQLAFSVLNTVLLFCRQDQCLLLQNVAQQSIDLIPRFWQGKFNTHDQMLNSVRDETMILFFAVHLHLERSLLDDSTSTLISKVEDLLSVLRAEYSRRSDKDQLHLQDVDMVNVEENAPALTPFSLHAFRLRPHNARAERNWANLQVIGLLERLVSLDNDRKKKPGPKTNVDLDVHPRKRQRTAPLSHPLLDPIKDDDQRLRLAALQILPFVLQSCQFPTTVLEELITQLSICTSDKRGHIASWAFLAIASCTYQKSLVKQTCIDWSLLWRIGSRALTFQGTCRAAATHMHSMTAAGLIQYHEIAEDVDTMIASADISGPTILCDSSVFFMMHILNARVTEVPGASLTASSHVIRWLFARWNPADRSHDAQTALLVPPHHLVDLLRTCFGLTKAPISASSSISCGPVAQAWQQHLLTEDVIRYLLLLGQSTTAISIATCKSCPKYSKNNDTVFILDNAHFHITRKLILELLNPKVSDLLSTWSADGSVMSADSFQRALYAIMTMLLLSPYFTDSKLPQVQSLEHDIEAVTAKLVEFLSDSQSKNNNEVETLTEIMLRSIRSYLPPCDNMETALTQEATPQLLTFFYTLAAYLRTSSPDSGDMMDLDEDAIHREDRPTRKSPSGIEEINSIPRLCHSLEMNDLAFLAAIKARLVLLDTLKDEPESAGNVPSAFVDHLIELSDEEILLSGQFLKEVLDSNLFLSSEDGTRLIKRFGEFIGSDEWTRCEVSQSLCLDILIGIGQQWIHGSHSNLTGLATDIYHWFLDVDEKWIRPPEVEKRFASLLLLLARLDPNNSILPSASSPRTSLINILYHGNVSVKFFVGSQLPKFFDIYVANTHDDVFLDILKHLPSNSDWIEGIAFRLFVLARIASQWPDLLRRCIYHIFEIPPRVPNAMDHATRCLNDLSIALKVDGPRNLLALFAPQILYTWLEESSLQEIPFQIFGFTTLKDLLVDVQHVAAGLLIMRGQDAAFEGLAELLEIQEYQLLRDSFTQIMAYMIAHDMSTPPVKNQKRLGEPWVMKRLGNVAFLECLNYHFADIVAFLFNTIDHGEMEKYLLRKKEQAYAGKIMGEIRSYNRSQVKLPHHQQPAFKSKYLTDWINHLCIRTQYHPEALYTASLVTSIARSLLNTVHPALGPMHSCTVLRKLCALISLAGNTAVQGYPLEMLLQAVSTYITTAECAEDASGILQYLLMHGQHYLSTSPSFVAGIALSILGRLRTLLNQSQPSTTQESQYKATKSKAREFHTWAGKYFLEYKSPVLKGAQQARLCALVRSACNIGLLGNAETGTPESDLLFQLLEDEQTTDCLLSRPSREHALAMLCSNFRVPDSFLRDILGSDQTAIDYAAVVWISSRGASASKEYLSWAGRVLGRAFAASGQLHRQLLQESSLSQLDELSPSLKVHPEYASKACLLSLMQHLTLSADQRTVGLAEGALRSILTAAATTAEDPALLETCYQCLSKSLAEASSWPPYVIPPSGLQSPGMDNISDPFTTEAIKQASWLRDLSVVLARYIPDDPVLTALVPILQEVSGFAYQAFPFILHLALSITSKAQHLAKKNISRSMSEWFSISETVEKTKLRMLINSILYLRTQPHIGERSSSNGSHWIDVDYIKAAITATNCGMYKTALLFIEEFCSTNTSAKSSRRSSAIGQEPSDLPQDLLLNIFKNIDDPDLYYGVRQNASLKTILARVEYERDGPKSLAFRGAQYDSRVRQDDPRSAEDAQSLVKALDVLSLSGLSYSLLQAQKTVGMSSSSLNSMFDTARKLEKWDIPVPSNCTGNSLTIYKAFQAVQNTSNHGASINIINEGFESTMASLVQNESSAHALHDTLQTLAVLVELDEVISTRSSVEFEVMLTRFNCRSGWMRTGRFDDISQILSCRGTTLSTLSQNARLQKTVGIVPMDARLVEVHTALLASDLNRSHNALQESLTVTTSLIDLIAPCKHVGLSVEAAIRLEEAHVLWDQGEMASSIGMLQDLWEAPGLNKQNIPIGRADLLSRIGSQVSVARLEKPDDILHNYLKPALAELKGKSEGKEAGKVFHQFAFFCDQQIQDPDSIEDLERLERLRREKADDVERLTSMSTKTLNSKDKKSISAQLAKSKTWLKLDDDELHRHRKSREEFLQKCLENYLLALRASDEHDINALRFTALWLEHSGETKANATVLAHLEGVPSRKFAPLMNQLSSRLQDSLPPSVTVIYPDPKGSPDSIKSKSETSFQEQLFSLVLRICIDHPFSGMYQIYATAHSRPNQKDEVAVSRRNAASNISKKLLENSKSAVIWGSILHINKVYCLFAAEKDDRYKSGRKIALKDSPNGRALQNTIAKYPVPPPTMHIKLVADRDYSKVPNMSKLEPQLAIASGVSCPKIITVIGTNGLRYKQLVKGGNDDLRQDAIMEQVFEQVSELLKINRSTRQRDLGIRTYKVLPLTSTAGIIEFVPDTIPLHEYLMPAHERYFPKDLKGQQCRKEIQEAQSKHLQERVKVYRNVIERFHPVMRYFFIEKFNDPDEWFVRRLAYTRSTAAISILGHVLGLGDRHGHNILLDSKSGEVVHIDLGVAFEMGRILPVPEVVPFRLTRDIVDGMGITKTEGVFRRCCEFTLEALRKEASSISAILDVLRYDPLYSWSVSPLRLAKLQEGQSLAAVSEPDAEVAPIPQKMKQTVNEPGEADRALTMINKKLSKTLSVTATVNDLINQAIDEKNLAVLYSGWAAYA